MTVDQFIAATKQKANADSNGEYTMAYLAGRLEYAAHSALIAMVNSKDPEMNLIAKRIMQISEF